MRRPLAALTGGTGFIGRYIARSLVAHGWRLRLLVRHDPIHPQLADLCPEVAFGDLHQEEALRGLVRDADAVIHAAGLIKARHDRDFFAANAIGSEQVGKAIRQHAPHARLIVISSLAAREPQLSPYAASKRAGEDAAVTACGTSLWTILRPSAVYGPWDRETLRIFQAARHSLLVFPAAASRIALIHAAELAEAVAAVAADRDAHGIFEITDSRWTGYSWREIATAAASAVDTTSPQVIHLPSALLRLATPMLYAAHLIGAAGILTPGKLREILHEDWSSKPSAQLPPSIWSPHIDLNKGFSETARWYTDNGWMKSMMRLG